MFKELGIGIAVGLVVAALLLIAADVRSIRCEIVKAVQCSYLPWSSK